MTIHTYRLMRSCCHNRYSIGDKSIHLPRPTSHCETNRSWDIWPTIRLSIRCQHWEVSFIIFKTLSIDSVGYTWRTYCSIMHSILRNTTSEDT